MEIRPFPLLHHSHLLRAALAEYRLAIGLALVALLLALVLGLSRRERPRLAALLSLFAAAPFYLWALHGALSFLALFDRIGSGPRWAEVLQVAILEAVALPGVLIPVALSLLLVRRKVPWGAGQFVGPVAAVATAFLDWVFYLAVFSPPW